MPFEAPVTTATLPASFWDMTWLLLNGTEPSQKSSTRCFATRVAALSVAAASLRNTVLYRRPWRVLHEIFAPGVFPAKLATLAPADATGCKAAGSRLYSLLWPMQFAKENDMLTVQPI